MNPLDDEDKVQAAAVQIDRVAKGYTRRLRGDADMHADLVQEGWSQLAADARTWKPAKGSWAVFVRMVTRAAMRRALYVQRAPVSGSPWRASKWAKDLRGVGVDPDAFVTDDTASPEGVLIGRRFVDTLMSMLEDTASLVPDGRLGMRVILGEDPAGVARGAGVSVAVVSRAARGLREVIRHNAALCSYVEEEGHG